MSALVDQPPPHTASLLSLTVLEPGRNNTCSCAVACDAVAASELFCAVLNAIMCGFSQRGGDVRGKKRERKQGQMT